MYLLTATAELYPVYLHCVKGNTKHAVRGRDDP